MVKKLLIIVFFVLVFPCVAFADNDISDADMFDYSLHKENITQSDDVGHVTVGITYCSEYMWGDTYADRVVKYSSDSGLYILKDGDSYAVYSCDGQGYSVHEEWWFSDSTSQINITDRSGNDGDAPWRGISGGCSIPIFDKSANDWEDKVNAYKENGDTSGASNQEDLVSSDPEYSDDVELPQNLKVISGHKYSLVNSVLLGLNKDVVLTWEQSVDTSDYLYDVDVSFELQHIVSKDVFVTEYYSVNRDVEYKNSKNITCTLDHENFKNFLNDYYSNDYPNKDKVADMGCFIRKLNIRVRNKSGNSCSNYVVSTIDFGNKSVSNSEVDENGDVANNPQYDNDDGAYHDDDDDVSISSSGGLKNISLWIKKLKSGFGLAGDNGLFGFFKSFFNSVIPAGDQYWDIILAGVAAIVIIGVVNFILKR